MLLLKLGTNKVYHQWIGGTFDENSKIYKSAKLYIIKKTGRLINIIFKYKKNCELTIHEKTCTIEEGTVTISSIIYGDTEISKSNKIKW